MPASTPGARSSPATSRRTSTSATSPPPQQAVRAGDRRARRRLGRRRFDARFSATWRHYRYDVWNDPTPNPLLAGRAWFVPQPLTLWAMQAACDPLIGEHDFSSFCRAPKLVADQPEPSMVRRVLSARWRQLDDPGHLRFEIRANAFCHQMVRSIVGTLVDVGLGKASPATCAASSSPATVRPPARWPPRTASSCGRSVTPRPGHGAGLNARGRRSRREFRSTTDDRRRPRPQHLMPRRDRGTAARGRAAWGPGGGGDAVRHQRGVHRRRAGGAVPEVHVSTVYRTLGLLEEIGESATSTCPTAGALRERATPSAPPRVRGLRPPRPVPSRCSTGAPASRDSTSSSTARTSPSSAAAAPAPSAERRIRPICERFAGELDLRPARIYRGEGRRDRCRDAHPGRVHRRPDVAARGVVAIAGVTWCLRDVRTLDDRDIPVVGLVAAFVFAAQMLNFPVAADEGHLLGGCWPLCSSVRLGAGGGRGPRGPGAAVRRRRPVGARPERRQHGPRRGVRGYAVFLVRGCSDGGSCPRPGSPLRRPGAGRRRLRGESPSAATTPSRSPSPGR